MPTSTKSDSSMFRQQRKMSYEQVRLNNKNKKVCMQMLQLKKMLSIKPGLHQSQLQVQWSVTLLFSIAVERCRHILQVSSIA